METHIYDQFAALENRHFWFRGRRAIFFDLLDQELGGPRQDLRILEVGCGPGGMLSPLSRYGTVHGLDIALDALRYCRHRGFPHMALGSGTQLPFADASFDLVALFDTIEHIQDDQGVLAEVRRILKPGGAVVVSVPAYQFLYSQNDRLVHHQRRYTRAHLDRLLRAERFAPRKLTYFNTFLFPLILPAVLVLKLKERLFGLPRGQTNLSHEFAPPINGLFAWLMATERWFLRHCEFPFGHSLVAIARV